MKNKYLYAIGGLLLITSCGEKYDEAVGQTAITKWHGGKNGAVSLTFDDGSINQFTVAMPILDSLDIPGTFYLITGQIPGSQYHGTFIGRPGEEIIKETATVPTSEANLFERASAIGYLGYEGGMSYHTRAGSALDADNMERAIEIIEEGYAQIRAGKLKREPAKDSYIFEQDTTTWDQLREYAARGHEFGSHTVTHPRLAILDEPNMIYELEKSREDILAQLGREHLFSAECPFGTENERVMEYAWPRYPALRNRMPEPFLHELNRWDTLTPGQTDNEYVQWQRGPLQKTSMDLMKSWVDTVAANDNAWLVLVFHGVEGIGWEAKPRTELKEYFEYVAGKKDQLWVATFRDVTKYMRERMSAKVEGTIRGDEITVSLTHPLDTAWYHHPLTLKTLVPADWANVQVEQGGDSLKAEVMKEGGDTFVLYSAQPNAGEIKISEKS